MRGPLPLTPTPALTSVPTSLNCNINLPLAGAVEPRGDNSLPELLVRDLELSKSVFEDRNMTSGAPKSTIMSPYFKSKPSPTHASSTKPFRTASLRIQSLDALEDRDPMASFSTDSEPVLNFDDTASDADSYTGTEASYDAGPSTFHVRNHSIVTTATSLASSSRRPSSKSISPVFSSWRPSSGNLQSPKELPRESSWIEAESESEDEGQVALREFCQQLHYQEDQPGLHQHHRQPSFDHRSPRSPKLATSPSSSRSDDGPREPVQIIRSSHRKSSSMSGPVPGNVAPQSNRSKSDTWPSSSGRSEARSMTSNQDGVLALPSLTSRFSTELRPRQAARRGTPEEDIMVQAPKTLMKSRIPEEAQGPATSSEKRLTKRHQSATHTRPSSPSPSPSQAPRVSIQSQNPRSQSKIDDDSGSSKPFVLPFQDDELARIVPLPPDVVETLRISTMCFPETMLLSSSLTVETIRSYSKKVRQPGAKNASVAASTPFAFTAGLAGPVRQAELSSPISGNGSGTKSRWRRVVSRGSSSKRKRESRLWGGSPEPPSVTVVEAPKPWLALKSVFGNCSDYICDALYAHILAYNYVSALVASNPSSTTANNRRSCSDGLSDTEDIPKKAASLLGFGHSASVALMGVASRAAKKPRSSSKTSGVSSNDTALRSIQCELQRCIRQLISTARLMAQGGSAEGDERPSEMEMQDNDRLLMRSLCEIVRLSEGAAACSC